MSSAPTSPVTNTRLRPRAWIASATSIRESSSLGATPVSRSRNGIGTPSEPGSLAPSANRSSVGKPSSSAACRIDGGDVDDLLEVVRADRARGGCRRSTTTSGRVVSTSCFTTSVPVRAEVRQWMWRMSSPGTYSRSWWNDAVPFDTSRVGPSRSRSRPDGQHVQRVPLGADRHRARATDPALGRDEAERDRCAAGPSVRRPRCPAGWSRART